MSAEKPSMASTFASETDALLKKAETGTLTDEDIVYLLTLIEEWQRQAEWLRVLRDRLDKLNDHA